jgi:hypothetical protein
MYQSFFKLYQKELGLKGVAEKYEVRTRAWTETAASIFTNLLLKSSPYLCTLIPRIRPGRSSTPPVRWHSDTRTP